MHDRFVDRDMFMRFLGGGIGHKAPRGHDTAEDAHNDVEGECGDDNPSSGPEADRIMAEVSDEEEDDQQEHVDEEDDEERLDDEDDYSYRDRAPDPVGLI
jgi:hypothetical protein